VVSGDAGSELEQKALVVKIPVLAAVGARLASLRSSRLLRT
jgi:formate dehydrogenase assembly factor FdhD